MYSRLSNLILGFHGCKKTTFENVLYNHEDLIDSTNQYDWLGHGVYFWESNYERALSFAEEMKALGRIKGEVAVIGAVIDLGCCLNLLDEKCLKIVRQGYDNLKNILSASGKAMPENKPKKNGKDLLFRDLDCAVINTIHKTNEKLKLPAYDSVRGAFIEGEDLYPNAGFKAKNHIQICVRNHKCIKGYFKPII